MNNDHKPSKESEEFRARLANRTGREFWRGMHELAETEEFQAFLEDEFPQQARPLQMPVDRRHFLTMMGASLALAGLSGCRFLPQDKIVPYVNQPEEMLIGVPLFFTTAMSLGGYGLGLLAESHEGRPTKLEGNPQHPASLGATTAMAQAAILGLYDPDRAQNITQQGDISTWDGTGSFLEAMRAALAKQAGSGGAGIRIVTETVSSPSLVSQMRVLLGKYPAAKWIQYEPANRDNVLEGARLAFGKPLNTVYRFSHADVVLALDADLFLGMPGSVRYARDFMDRRRIRKTNSIMNRLYSVESAPSITGATADNVLRVKSSEIELYARALAAELGIPGFTPVKTSVPDVWVKAVAADLKSAGARGLVAAGDYQSPAVHAIAHAINASLGSAGNAVYQTQPIEADWTNQTVALKQLADEMNAGQVQMLFVLGGNPVYSAPADIDFAGPLRANKVPFTMHLGMHEDETTALCQWHIPEAHFLEAWGDVRAFDGTVSIVQPLITPLWDGRSVLDMVASINSTVDSSYDIVNGYWAQKSPGAASAGAWERYLLDGLIAGSAYTPQSVPVQANVAADIGPAPAPQKGMEVIFRPDPTIWDGRFANNPWLQELPKPLVKYSWDNAALVSPVTAVKLGLGDSENSYDDVSAAQGNERIVDLTVNGRTVRVPIWVLPGHPDDAITLNLGYGRTKTGQVGENIGFNAGLLRTSASPWFTAGAAAAKTAEKHPIATTQYHHSMAGRDIIRTRDITHFRRNPGLTTDTREPVGSSSSPELQAGEGTDLAFGTGGLLGKADSPSIYDGKDHQYEGYAWAMSVDLTTCIGCNACVQACQAENNIPVVGKDQVMRGRDMHWLRIDTYYRGQNTNAPEGTYFQPVMCMHCELAPCEPVCPVAATVHSHEGLNQMIYNRCVGTKYCSNNCPYKVRRFNFYKYIAGQPNNAPGNYDAPVMKLSANPNVTLRGRGVMEKCSFCVQRINSARINAKKEDRTVRDGEIQTACQQACPTRTIVFGNMADPNAEVTRLKKEPHDYSLLGDLDTRPRLTYLTKIKNPNPALEARA